MPNSFTPPEFVTGFPPRRRPRPPPGPENPWRRLFFIKCGEHLGEICSLLIDLLNPEKIVIGSIFARCEDLLREPMQQIIDREALSRSARACSVVPAALGETLGDVAALAVAADLAARQNFSMSRRKEK